MDLIKIAQERHVVRHFDGKPLSQNDVEKLNLFIEKLNKQYGMHNQLLINEPKAFGGEKAKMSNITGCVNYLALIAKNNNDAELLSGYVGEQIVLMAQSMGINSCWAALTYDKQMDLYNINGDEKLVLVIALGYGLIQGKPHISKKISDVCKNNGQLPQWFINGLEMALNAPTGKNQQGFMFELLDNNIVKLTNESFCKDVDKGIVMYHFEIGAGTNNFKWYKNK